MVVDRLVASCHYKKFLPARTLIPWNSFHMEYCNRTLWKTQYLGMNVSFCFYSWILLLLYLPTPIFSHFRMRNMIFPCYGQILYACFYVLTSCMHCNCRVQNESGCDFWITIWLLIYESMERYVNRWIVHCKPLIYGQLPPDSEGRARGQGGCCKSWIPALCVIFSNLIGPRCYW